MSFYNRCLLLKHCWCYSTCHLVTTVWRLRLTDHTLDPQICTSMPAIPSIYLRGKKSPDYSLALQPCLSTVTSNTKRSQSCPFPVFIQLHNAAVSPDWLILSTPAGSKFFLQMPTPSLPRVVRICKLTYSALSRGAICAELGLKSCYNFTPTKAQVYTLPVSTCWRMAKPGAVPEKDTSVL